MSELIEKKYHKNFLFQLLTTVSALALIGSSCAVAEAADSDSGKPLVWIELGGQFTRLDDGQETFSPPLMDARPSIFEPSQKLDGPPHLSIDGTGKLSFQPEDTNWVFSAAVSFGRSTNEKHVHQQTNPQAFAKYYYVTSAQYDGGVDSRHKTKHVNDPGSAKFADTNVDNGERHLVVDFQAGKDVGLGMFGSGSSSVFSLGVRFAQFSNNSKIALQSDPNWKFQYGTIPPTFRSIFLTTKFVIGSVFNSHQAYLHTTRNFHGVGPTISWTASAPILKRSSDSEATFDWGINAAVLFGRQRTKVHHQSTGRYHGPKYAKGQFAPTHSPVPVDVTRVCAVTVPNIGGFAGVTYRIQNFKVSAGYRADFFFGAMDGGIDTRKSENVGFYGPFASVSVGLGG